MDVVLTDDEFAKVREAIFRATSPHSDDEIREIITLLHRARATLEYVEEEPDVIVRRADLDAGDRGKTRQSW